MKLWPLVVLAVAACETRLDLGRDRAATGNDADDDDDDDVTDAGTDPAPSCADVCSRVIACGILDASDRNECLGRCSAGSTAADRACIMQSSCAVMADACGIPTGDETDPEDDAGIDTGEEAFQIQVCQDACDSAHFQGCLDGTQHAGCRARCATAPSGTRETFTSCIHTTTGDCSDSVACYDELEGGS